MNAIWLRRDGHHAIVCVEINGQWIEVIREFISAPFSHIWEGREPTHPVSTSPQPAVSGAKHE